MFAWRLLRKLRPLINASRPPRPRRGRRTDFKDPMSLSCSIRHLAAVTALGAAALPAAHAASFNPTLPAEPRLPTATEVCKTLTASLTQTGGLLPSSVDADPANSQPDTAQIQDAINHCPAGQAVRLVASGNANAFLSGPLVLNSNVTLWVDSNVTLFASRSPKDFDNGGGRCGTAGGDGKSCNALIRLKNAANSRIVGDGRIDGRGGAVLTSGPNAGKMTWWDVANLLEATGKKQNNPRLVNLIGGSNFTLYRISLLNSPNSHVVVSGLTGFVAWGTKVLAPSLAYTKPNYACAAGTTPDPDVAATRPSTCFTPATAANTDGIDVVESSKVRIAHSSISTGDDHIAIKAADAPANGLRIKTYDSVGGTVSNVIFANVCMRNVKQPLIFTPYYSSGNHSTAPNINDILLQNIHVLSSAKFGAGKLVFRGYRNGSVVNPLKMTLDNVVFDSTSFLTADGKKGGPTQPEDATLTLGPGPVTIPFAASSTFKLIDQRGGAQAPRACDSAFPPFPLAEAPI